jgi:hypothetical protein
MEHSSDFGGTQKQAKRKEKLSPMGMQSQHSKLAAAENNYNSTQRVPIKQRLLPRV